MALSGDPTRADECPLSGVKQTRRGLVSMSAYDPKADLCSGTMIGINRSSSHRLPIRSVVLLYGQYRCERRHSAQSQLIWSRKLRTASIVAGGLLVHKPMPEFACHLRGDKA